MSIEAKRAEEAAKAAFQGHLAGRQIRADLLPRLSLGVEREGGEWLFQILLHDEAADGSKGLAEDLIQPRPTQVAMIRVDGKTYQASIEQWDIPTSEFDSGS